MTARRVEYRVRWRREGRGGTTRIYQTWSAAYRKAQGIAALEFVKADTTLAGMADLVEGPTIEVREVGAWAPNEVQPNPPADYLLERMRHHFAPDEAESAGDPW